MYLAPLLLGIGVVVLLNKMTKVEKRVNAKLDRVSRNAWWWGIIIGIVTTLLTLLWSCN